MPTPVTKPTLVSPTIQKKYQKSWKAKYQGKWYPVKAVKDVGPHNVYVLDGIDKLVKQTELQDLDMVAAYHRLTSEALTFVGHRIEEPKMTFLKRIEIRAAQRKTSRELKLKDGRVIPKDTPVEIKWLPKEQNGHALAEVHAGGEVFKTKIRNFHTFIQGFPKPPTNATLEKWVGDGVAKTVTGQKVEPDGWGSDGSPSWLLAMGLI
jgi:hypothetical protein